MQIPNPTAGLHHVALFAKNFDACMRFYTELLGMHIVWHPDIDNVYLSSGTDNLALHRAPQEFIPTPHQHLDHIGFFLRERQDVDQWHEFLRAQGITIKVAPKDHRDGTRSFYCEDPDGNVVQFIYIKL
ncbi:MAG: glyoxalase [Gammaproteobacteria bacterium RIFCSPHIGHO2_12_FULL_41_20]|nr:MAG: glyoxalase [Gammaproteobacteria bacterium RIFCSPHIGHO2_12_FULL_41_20]